MLFVFSVTHFFTCAGYGAPTNVKVWKNADVLEWASSFSFSEDNRTTIIEFLRGGITGKVLLVLTNAKLRVFDLPIGPAIELMLAIDALKAEIGMRGLCGVSTREVFLCRSVTFHAPGACGPCFPPCVLFQAFCVFVVHAFMLTTLFCEMLVLSLLLFLESPFLLAAHRSDDVGSSTGGAASSSARGMSNEDEKGF